ncbi:hypothetical protein YPPY15_2848, partial [Yersinia pestis PY-15]
MIIITAGGYAR